MLRVMIGVVYACVTLFTVLNHEPWRDEAQFWLIARDCSLPQLLCEMPYQTHAALWYLIISPLAALGLPFVACSLAHWAIAVTSVGLLLAYAPFPTLTKCLAAFSYFLFWQYCIEARQYALSVLILFLTAVAYPSRLTHPFRYGILICLLFNNDLLVFPVAAILLAMWGLEAMKGGLSKALIAGNGGMVIISAFAGLWQVGILSPPADVHGGTPDNLGFQISAIWKAMVGMFFTGSGPVSLLAAPATLTLLALVSPLFSRPRALITCAFHLSGLFLVTGMRPISSMERHYGIIWIGVLFCLWIAQYEKDVPLANRLFKGFPDFRTRSRYAILYLNLSLIGSMGLGWMMHWLEWKYDYSGNTRMAAYIKSNKLDSMPIAAHRYSRISSLAAYLPGKKLWDAGAMRYQTYFHQNLEHWTADVVPYEKALERIDLQFPPPQELLILLDTPLPASLHSKYQPIFQVDSTVFAWDERCYLYRRLIP